MCAHLYGSGFQSHPHYYTGPGASLHQLHFLRIITTYNKGASMNAPSAAPYKRRHQKSVKHQQLQTLQSSQEEAFNQVFFFLRKATSIFNKE